MAPSGDLAQLAQKGDEFAFGEEKWYKLTEPVERGGDGKGLLKIHPINHYAYETTNVLRILAFYCDVLGFRPVYHAPLAFKGSWLCLPTGYLTYKEDATPQELLAPPPGEGWTFCGKPSPNNHDQSFPSAFPEVPQMISRGHHVALRTLEMDYVMRKLDEKGIMFFTTTVVSFFDPDGNGVEIGEFLELQPPIIPAAQLEVLLDQQEGLKGR
ncbi:hypothetical protein M427DRAFT_157416 [Gonapodya prolifera JEL478]|uniref:VOC domain-containing protein n=1 Tax=Gonapodya prolifera (strain JEL478) TaxID=1344416 RepID=A0A139A6A0_GONPJ|nr:hypothetical protein M427DRAFT_157416 [Gonapodya prolifera JEL478]|eukprot:KXS12317.1 hypothetical protein M427DRAFT_157416 [Gonapodya prolifera JEL478]